MSVIVERQGAVTTLIIDRPAARNAIDRPTAAALADAFRAFDADPAASVAVADRVSLPWPIAVRSAATRV